MIQIRKELHEKNIEIKEQEEQYKNLKKLNDELQAKRKQLLEAL